MEKNVIYAGSRHLDPPHARNKRHLWRNVIYDRAGAGVTRVLGGDAKIDNVIVTLQHQTEPPRKMPGIRCAPATQS